MKKRKLKRNVIIIAVAIIIVLAGIIGYLVYVDLKQEDILREEIAIINKKDITEDSYKIPIKTHGDYAKVEKAIKEYLDDYATTLQSLIKLVDDKELANMLTADNYTKDGPDFVNSKQYLTKTKQDFNDKVVKLTEMTTEEAIMDNIKKYNLEDYYVDLYRELMSNGMESEDLIAAQQELNSVSEKINNLINNEEAIINLLIQNKGKWSIQNERIVFTETSVLSQYNELTKKISESA